MKYNLINLRACFLNPLTTEDRVGVLVYRILRLSRSRSRAGGRGRRHGGLAAQSSAYQREAAQRPRRPYALLSEARLQLTATLTLPTFTVQARLPPETHRPRTFSPGYELGRHIVGN